ncbi:MAG: hypothetical protein LBE25_13615 [Arthrobacter sp.]|jgi:hypothetical protein|nr:hypothetical protein [Arthrobacter sp.]
MTMPITPKIILENAEALNKPVKDAMDGVGEALQELVEDGEEWTTNEVRAAMDMAQIGLLKAVVLAINANTSALTIQALIAADAGENNTEEGQ